MKKFTKLFLSCAAIAAVTAAVATSAMAADITGGLSGTYEDGKLSIVAPNDIDAAKAATLLVYDASADVTDLSAETDVVGIDQSKAGTAFENTGLKGAPTEEDGTTYVVALGYYTKAGDFTVTTGKLFSNGQILIGDADQDGFVDGGDATAILKVNVGTYTFVDNGEEAADADQDGYVDGGDATAILKFTVDKIDSTNDKVNTYK